MALAPVTLEGRLARLEPLSVAHHAALAAVAFDPELWRWVPEVVRTPDDLARYIATALSWQAAGTALPFAIVERATGQVIGSTRFANIALAHRRLEIGWTWLARPWQRTPVNTEAKYLLLRHAFEVLSCLRVELKTDALNERSRAAIRRLGAVEEGTFRNHIVTWTGRVRHTVWYSIIDSEWPAVKSSLEAQLARPWPPTPTAAPP